MTGVSGMHTSDEVLSPLRAGRVISNREMQKTAKVVVTRLQAHDVVKKVWNEVTHTHLLDRSRFASNLLGACTVALEHTGRQCRHASGRRSFVSCSSCFLFMFLVDVTADVACW